MKEGMGLRSSVTLENNSTKMNIEYAKPTETKDTQMKTENPKNCMSKIIANDDQEIDEVDLIDQEELNNPQYVVEYVKEIFEYLRSEEVNFLI